jgi:hypothetical protein
LKEHWKNEKKCSLIFMPYGLQKKLGALNQETVDIICPKIRKGMLGMTQFGEVRTEVFI